MSHPVIQAKYEVLEEVAQVFEAAAGGIEEELLAVERVRDNLRGEWVGLGSEAFFHEVDDDVVPAMWRLVHALREAARLSRLASQIIGEAEIEAAALFQDDAPFQFKVPGKHSIQGPPTPIRTGRASGHDRACFWLRGSTRITTTPSSASPITAP